MSTTVYMFSRRNKENMLWLKKKIQTKNKTYMYYLELWKLFFSFHRKFDLDLHFLHYNSLRKGKKK